ncbi:hypothetical protein F2P56_003252, partial [Juglans regia]
MPNSKSVSTPMSCSEKLIALYGYTFEDPQWYWRVVGSLQYLAFTRPDISFAVNRCPNDRRSTRGFCIYFGNHLVSWGSKKQPTIARSSTEAEYKSVASTACEVLWLQPLLRELGIVIPELPTLWYDNIGATYLSMNPVMHSKTKHVELDYHF